MNPKLKSSRVKLLMAISFPLLFIGFMIPPAEGIHGFQFPLCDIFDPVNPCNVTGNFFWSRDSGDNHLDELFCDIENPEQCLVPYFFDSNIVDIGMSLSEIQSEAAVTELTIESMSPNIGIADVPQTSVNDNRVDSGNFPPGIFALYKGDRHCTSGFPVCITKDDHIERIEIRLNTDSSVVFDNFENCNQSPKIRDLEKTFNSEFTHMLGFGHNNDEDSIVAAEYKCGQSGYFPLFHDIEEVLDKYEGDWIVDSDYTMKLGQQPSEHTMTLPENLLVKNNAVLTIESPLTLEIDFVNYNLTVESGSGILIKSGAKISSPP